VIEARAHNLDDLAIDALREIERRRDQPPATLVTRREQLRDRFKHADR